LFLLDLGDFGALGVTLGDLGVTWGAPDALMLSIIRKYLFLFYFVLSIGTPYAFQRPDFPSRNPAQFVNVGIL
jgi:hypothetical protein